MKVIFCLALILILFSCGSNKAGDSISLKEIDSITITKQYNSIAEDTTKKLTVVSEQAFIDKWNNSRSSGPWKFIPAYTLTVHLKNNKQIPFRVAGQNVKQKNDWCVDFGDEKFFDNLWNNGSK